MTKLEAQKILTDNSDVSATQITIALEDCAQIRKEIEEYYEIN